MRLYHFFKFTLIAFCVLSGAVTAQTLSRIDSLKQKLLNAQGHDRFDLLNELFKESKSSNYSEALSFATEFDNLATTIGDSVRMVQGGRMKAYSLMDLGRNEEAVQILMRILGIAKRNSEKYPELKGQIKYILNNTGIANTYLGNYDKALDFHFKSLVIREEEGDKKSIRPALNNIGLVFYNLKDYDRAIEYYLKSIDISKELNDFSGFEGVYINLGLSYGQLGEFDKAIKYYKEGFGICKDNCGDNIVKEGLEGLGLAYLGNHQLEMAKENFLKSLEISRRQNDKRYLAENLYELGKIEIQLKNENLGLTYLKEAQSLAESINLAEVKLWIYNEFASYYGQKGEYQKSYSYQHKYIKFKDSIFSEQLIKNLTKVQTNYDQRENLKTIAEKDQVVTLQKELYDRLQRQYFFIITITCLVVSLAIILFYFTRRQQKVNRQLSEAKNKIEDQNLILASHNKELEEKVAARTQDLILANKALRQVNDELDNFIYKTSHDIRGPLATLKGMCNVALMDIRDPLAIDYLKKLDVTADRMNTILTRLMIVNQINGSVLIPVMVNFGEVLNDIFAFEQKKGLPPRLTISCEVEKDSSIISDVALVRIILENLVDNAIKFYNTSERLDPYVKVRVFKYQNRLKATVEDNGIGMTYRDGKDVFQMFMRASERSEIGGIGLYLAKLASEKIGGEINLIHSDSKGSLFEVSFGQDLRDIISLRSQGEQNLIDLMEKHSESGHGQTLRPTDK